MINRFLTLVRENEGLTIHETAHRLGVSPDEVLDYETGRQVPSEGMLEEYSNIFGVPVSSIEFFSEQETDSILSSNTRLFFADKFVQLVEKAMMCKA